MPIPLVIGAAMGAIALAGVIAQAVNNSKTSKAEAKEVKKLEDLQRQIQQPNFDISKITPQDLQVVYNYNPEAVKVIEEKYPQLVEKSQLAQTGTEAQMSALERFGKLAETGQDEALVAERNAARREAEQGFSRTTEAREAQAQRRGLGLGSGAQLALSQADQSALAQQQLTANERSAADAALRRMQASQTQAQLGGAITGQELGLASQNAALINAYNTRTAERGQSVEGMNVGARNQANQQRAMLQNETAQRNVLQRNQANQDYQNRLNEMRQQQFQNQNTSFGQQAGISQQRMGNIANRSQRTAQTISGVTEAGMSIGKMMAGGAGGGGGF